MRSTFLITAGPTREYLDPVRYFTNASSGKMGYALARAARRRGHRVILLSGPVDLPAPKGVGVIRIETAREMFARAIKLARAADIVIGAAAVADYRPQRTAKHKIKKSGRPLSVRLVSNPDIIGTIGRKKGTRIVIGFALESKDLLRSARKKLKEKNLDMIVANSPEVIGNDRASVCLVYRDKGPKPLAGIRKDRAAERIIDEALRLRHRDTPGKTIS